MCPSFWLYDATFIHLCKSRASTRVEHHGGTSSGRLARDIQLPRSISVWRLSGLTTHRHGWLWFGVK
ncbi:hypothetical protein IF1G_04985 [Cordyceps javanica]|uniref:Uncharacterized protein n=1 Tax=Cordyceps javanica TaxID=43265 RepID=A0A545V3W5_9HYPO|nr:hypothetical protein IF1G_04985 [Cordyceps javanica]